METSESHKKAIYRGFAFCIYSIASGELLLTVRFHLQSWLQNRSVTSWLYWPAMTTQRKSAQAAYLSGIDMHLLSIILYVGESLSKESRIHSGRTRPSGLKDAITYTRLVMSVITSTTLYKQMFEKSITKYFIKVHNQDDTFIIDTKRIDGLKMVQN